MTSILWSVAPITGMTGNTVANATLPSTENLSNKHFTKKEQNMSYNKIILIGNTTAHPELKELRGNPCTRFGLAVSRKYKDTAGEWKEDTLFIDVDAFGKNAESLCKYAGKGREILVEGSLRFAKWTDKNTGEQKTKYSVFLERYAFTNGSPKKAEDGATTETEQPKQQANATTRNTQPPEADEEVPF